MTKDDAFYLDNIQGSEHVQSLLRKRGLRVGQRVIDDILKESLSYHSTFLPPTLLPSLTLSLHEGLEEQDHVGQADHLGSSSHEEEREEQEVDQNKRKRYSAGGIAVAIEEKLGPLHSMMTSGRFVYATIQALASRYTSQKIDPILIDSILEKERMEPKKKVHQQDWATTTLDLMTDVLILTYGLVDNGHEPPILDEVQQRYERVMGIALDTSKIKDIVHYFLDGDQMKFPFKKLDSSYYENRPASSDKEISNDSDTKKDSKLSEKQQIQNNSLQLSFRFRKKVPAALDGKQYLLPFDDINLDSDHPIQDRPVNDHPMSNPLAVKGKEGTDGKKVPLDSNNPGHLESPNQYSRIQLHFPFSEDILLETGCIPDRTNEEFRLEYLIRDTKSSKEKGKKDRKRDSKKDSKDDEISGRYRSMRELGDKIRQLSKEIALPKHSYEAGVLYVFPASGSYWLGWNCLDPKENPDPHYGIRSFSIIAEIEFAKDISEEMKSLNDTGNREINLNEGGEKEVKKKRSSKKLGREKKEKHKPNGASRSRTDDADDDDQPTESTNSFDNDDHTHPGVNMSIVNEMVESLLQRFWKDQYTPPRRHPARRRD
ncbi:hypothetical protein HYT52_04775 [Candidatus Woesearchaeota archaeon]|nr:hypothetical protein [Candidatus Woesearchaeota archaeon]